LAYNPVRILGVLGLAGLALTTLILAGLTATRLSGVTQLGPWGVAAVFIALVAGVTGLSLFALGVTFNYLVTLFYKRPVRQGLFGKPLFKAPLDRQFGWMGALAVALGLVIAGVSLGLGVSGWEIARLWLYLLGSAMLVLMGVQLVTYWILLRVLDELSQREILAQNDLSHGVEN
jgi:hypothetical protein